MTSRPPPRTRSTRSRCSVSTSRNSMSAWPSRRTPPERGSATAPRRPSSAARPGSEWAASAPSIPAPGAVGARLEPRGQASPPAGRDCGPCGQPPQVSSRPPGVWQHAHVCGCDVTRPHHPPHVCWLCRAGRLLPAMAVGPSRRRRRGGARLTRKIHQPWGVTARSPPCGKDAQARGGRPAGRIQFSSPFRLRGGPGMFSRTSLASWDFFTITSLSFTAVCILRTLDWFLGGTAHMGTGRAQPAALRTQAAATCPWGAGSFAQDTAGNPELAPAALSCGAVGCARGQWHTVAHRGCHATGVSRSSWHKRHRGCPSPGLQEAAGSVTGQTGSAQCWPRAGVAAAAPARCPGEPSHTAPAAAAAVHRAPSCSRTAPVAAGTPRPIFPRPGSRHPAKPRLTGSPTPCQEHGEDGGERERERR